MNSDDIKELLVGFIYGNAEEGLFGVDEMKIALKTIKHFHYNIEGVLEIVDFIIYGDKDEVSIIQDLKEDKEFKQYKPIIDEINNILQTIESKKRILI